MIYTDNSSCLLNYEGTTRNISARAIRFILRIQARLGPNVHYKHISSLKNVVADHISRLEEDLRYHPKHELNNIALPTQGESTGVQRPVDSCDCDLCVPAALNVVTRSATLEIDVTERVRQLHSMNHASQGKLLQICQKQNIKHVNLKEIVRKVVYECPYCLTEIKLLANKVLGVTETPTREMHTIHCDHTYMPVRSKTGDKYLVTIIDPFSKFLMAVPVKTLTMDRFCQILTQVLLQFNQIRHVRFDNAFNAKKVRDTCHIFDVVPILNASFNSRENCVERAHLTLKTKILNFQAQQALGPDEWHLVLGSSLEAINTVPHSATGLSPFEVVYNHPPLLYEFEDYDACTPEKRLQRESILAKLLHDKRTQSEKTQGPIPIPTVQPGDTIIVKYGPRNPKFFAKVICDHGMTVTIQRLDSNLNQHGKIKVAKRHVYLPNPNSHELGKIGACLSLLQT